MLRLADAIRLGSLTIEEPKAYAIRKCAIGMALNGSGKSVDEVLDDNFHSITHLGDTNLWLRHNRPLLEERKNIYAWYALRERFPWLLTFEALSVNCPRCPVSERKLMGHNVIAHVFDHHVMILQDMTLEQLADWVDSIDPTPRLPENEPELNCDEGTLYSSVIETR